MAVPEDHTEVFYGLQLATDTELMGVTMAWNTSGGVPSEEDCVGHYNRFAAAFDQLVSNQYSFPLARFTTGTSSGDFTREIVPTTPVTGSASGVAIPNNTAVLIAKITTSGGRRNRGRMFFPGMPQGAALANGQIVTGTRTLWQNAVDSWYEAEQTIGWGFGVLLHQTGSPLPTTITNLVVRGQLATQRRRMRG